MLPSPLTSRYFISPGSRLYFAASSASSNPQVPSCICPIKVLTGSPSRIILPAPPPCTPPPVWISDPPCNFKTLLRLMVKLKLVVQKKSGVEILWVVRESSIPLFSIFPIFSVTVAYPLDLGTGRLTTYPAKYVGINQPPARSHYSTGPAPVQNQPVRWFPISNPD